ncbi:MAG: nucleotide pyrophosphohydrolase [Tissierellia bacterium]|nr:nucleotide pyrophosphohydrolase [Tissierellia bacterium]
MKDQTTTIQEIKDKVAKFVDERDWNRFHSPKNLAMSIAIEAGELMEIFQWLTQEEAWDINNSEEAIHLREELSDVIIYCMSLANQLDIDISSSIEDKIRKNAIKYPVKKYKLGE